MVDDNGYQSQWLSMAMVAVCLDGRLLTDGLSEDVCIKYVKLPVLQNS